MKCQPIGVDDFKKIVDEKLFFVDKTMFIKEIIDDGSGVVLITRPRGFGKTVNMSMLRYYFEKSNEDTGYLFKDYKIWQQGDEYKNEQGKYPVISINFKDANLDNWHDNYRRICEIIASEFIRHSYILNSSEIGIYDKKVFEDIACLRATKVDYLKSLELLSRLLNKYHKKKLVILIDEYDTALNEAYSHGYWDEVVEFMGVFMLASFKNNINIHKGVLTSVLSMPSESMFSDLNNFNVCTILDDSYSEHFGFKKDEVEEILKYYNIEENIDKVADWYNGYVFGKRKLTTIYNSRSMLMYINKKLLEPYWVNTKDDAIIRRLVTEGPLEIQVGIYDIVEGNTIDDARIDENIVYNEIAKSDNAIWSFMLMSGYLKSVKTEAREGGVYCTLKAPNKEVYYFLRNVLKN